MTAFAPVSPSVEVAFTGEVTSVTDPSGFLAGFVSVGDAVEGRFVYDETVPDDHAKTDLGRYRFAEPSCLITADAGTLVFASDRAATDMTIRLLNDKKNNVVKDQFEVRSVANRDVLPGIAVSAIDIQLVDETAAALSSDALFGQRPDAAAWNPTRTLVVTGADGWSVEAAIDLVTSADPVVIRRGSRKKFRRE